MSRRPHLLVIDPAMITPEDQGAAEIARCWEGDWSIVRPCLRPGDGPGPSTGYDLDAVAVMGSKASVRDDHAWMRDLAAWLTPIVRGEVRRPLLGICFGHQLVAQLAGARVDWTHADRREERGFPETTLAGGRLVPGTHRLRVVASHYEAVHQVPAGFRVTASRPHVPIDGLEHVELPIFTWQFHPEGRDRFATKVGLDPEGIDVRLREDSRRLLDAFCVTANQLVEKK